MASPTHIDRRGLMFVLSSPSGAGKSTLSRKLLEKDGNLKLSISVTTRERRGSEVDGQDYHFITPEQFHRMREQGDLLEWAEVHSNFYGTPRGPVDRALDEGVDVLFDIDWQGTRQLAEACPRDVVRLFILPPSMRELRARLERRAEDSAEVIAQRLENARDEIARWGEYEYIVINDDIQVSLEKVEAILTAERTRRDRRPGLTGFVADLLDET